MSKQISITWIGPDLDVPGCGGFKSGITRKVNKEDADSLVRQGLAKYTNSKSKEEEKPSRSRRKDRIKEE
jgi:hypothetical protein